MGFFDKFKGVRKADQEDISQVYNPSFNVKAHKKAMNEEYELNTSQIKEDRRQKEKLDRELQKHIAEKKIDKRYAIDKERALQQEKIKGQIALKKFENQQKFEQEYGPGQFYIGGAKVPVLAKINQMKNFQQAQEIKRLKQDQTIQFQRLQQEKLRQEGQKLQGPRQAYNIGTSQSSFPQQPSMGFGMGLDINQGLTMGGGQGLGIGMQNNQGYEQQSFQSRDPLSIPVVGGLGGNPFGGQREETQQYNQQPQPVQRQQYVRPTPQPVPQRSYQVPRKIEGIPETDEGSVFIKVMESYGPKFNKVDPASVPPGTPLYRATRVRYKNSFARKFTRIK